jgi:hypothetical protein
MRRFARKVAHLALSHGFVLAYRSMGRKGAKWFERYAGPKLDRIMEANCRDAGFEWKAPRRSVFHDV